MKTGNSLKAIWILGPVAVLIFLATGLVTGCGRPIDLEAAAPGTEPGRQSLVPAGADPLGLRIVDQSDSDPESPSENINESDALKTLVKDSSIVIENVIQSKDRDLFLAWDGNGLGSPIRWVSYTFRQSDPTNEMHRDNEPGIAARDPRTGLWYLRLKKLMNGRIDVPTDFTNHVTLSILLEDSRQLTYEIRFQINTGIPKIDWANRPSNRATPTWIALGVALRAFHLREEKLANPSTKDVLIRFKAELNRPLEFSSVVRHHFWKSRAERGEGPTEHDELLRGNGKAVPSSLVVHVFGQSLEPKVFAIKLTGDWQHFLLPAGAQAYLDWEAKPSDDTRVCQLSQSVNRRFEWETTRARCGGGRERNCHDGVTRHSYEALETWEVTGAALKGDFQRELRVVEPYMLKNLKNPNYGGLGDLIDGSGYGMPGQVGSGFEGNSLSTPCVGYI